MYQKSFFNLYCKCCGQSRFGRFKILAVFRTGTETSAFILTRYRYRKVLLASYEEFLPVIFFATLTPSTLQIRAILTF